MSAASERGPAWWRRRAPRERRALALAAGVCALAAWGQLLWSAEAARQRLEPALARLEQAAALARATAAEMEQGRTAGAPAPAARVAAELPALPGLSVEAVAADRYRVRGTVDFAAWLHWSAGLLRDARLAVVSARLAAAGPGQVSLEAELEVAR